MFLQSRQNRSGGTHVWLPTWGEEWILWSATNERSKKDKSRTSNNNKQSLLTRKKKGQLVVCAFGGKKKEEEVVKNNPIPSPITQHLTSKTNPRNIHVGATCRTVVSSTTHNHCCLCLSLYTEKEKESQISKETPNCISTPSTTTTIIRERERESPCVSEAYPFVFSSKGGTGLFSLVRYDLREAIFWRVSSSFVL